VVCASTRVNRPRSTARRRTARYISRALEHGRDEVRRLYSSFIGELIGVERLLGRVGVGLLVLLTRQVEVAVHQLEGVFESLELCTLAGRGVFTGELAPLVLARGGLRRNRPDAGLQLIAELTDDLVHRDGGDNLGVAAFFRNRPGVRLPVSLRSGFGFGKCFNFAVRFRAVFWRVGI
jgi:hypothetical protein